MCITMSGKELVTSPPYNVYYCAEIFVFRPLQTKQQLLFEVNKFDIT